MLPALPLPVLLLAIAFALVFAVREQAAASRIRHEMEELSLDSPDPQTGLLPQAAVPLRLQPELEWSVVEGTHVGVVVLHVHGGRFDAAARTVRRAMRAHENAFSLGPNRMLVALWDVDEAGAVRAVARLGRRLSDAGFRVVDAGHTLSAAADDVAEELIEEAHRQLRPIDDYLVRRRGERPAALHALPGTAGARLARVLRRGVPALAVSLLLLVAAHVAIPEMFTEARAAGRVSPGALAIVVGFAALFALGVRAAWNMTSSPAPGAGGRLAPRQLGVLAFAAVVLLGWSVVAASSPLPGALLGALLVYQALLVLPPAAGRVLVRAEAASLLALAVVPFAGLALTYEALPLAANVFRILGAVLLGLALARFVERLAWVAAIVVLIAVTDIYSVFFGFTREQFETGGAALDVLLLTGPHVGVGPLFALGMADLVFMAFFLGIAHVWRLGVGRMAVACHVSLMASVALLLLLAVQAVPVLPLLALAFLVVAWRALRDDVAAVLEVLRPVRGAQAGSAHGADDAELPGVAAAHGGGRQGDTA